MYNASKPSPNELPSSATLLRSTIFAILGAGLILVTIVLPAEYGIDPIGVGRVLGLTEVGEIKAQLAAEAEANRGLTADAERMGGAETPVEVPVPAAETEQEAVAATAEGTLVETASPVEPETRSDEITIELAPGEGTEVKLAMKSGEKADFDWTANGSVLNYDQHGDGVGRSISYEKGRGVAKDDGVIEAAFDGYHGWFWRNRTDTNVKVTLRTSGTYLEFKRML